MREVLHHASADRVAVDGKYNGDASCGQPGRTCFGGGDREDQVDLEVDKISRKTGQAVKKTFSGTVLNRDVRADAPTMFCQPLLECAERSRV
jgi:hypothetical protein